MKNFCEWVLAVGLGFTGSLICTQVWRTMNFWILLSIGIAVCIAARIGIWLVDKRWVRNYLAPKEVKDGKATIDVSDVVGDVIGDHRRKP